MTNVYFIQCSKLIKIGKADDVTARLLQLQTGNPLGLTLVAVLPNVLPSVERVYHRYFHASRGRGEWFNYTKPIKRIIQQIQAGARPITVDAIEYYLGLKSLKDPPLPTPPKLRVKLRMFTTPDDQRDFGRACSEVRKAFKSMSPDAWTVARQALMARGAPFDVAVPYIESARRKILQ